MKTFKQFISETLKSCNKTKKGTYCPVHGDKSCYFSAIKDLEEGLRKLDNTSYDSIDKLMRSIMKENNITAKQLHNAFVDKHHKTPDEWIKSLNEELDGKTPRDPNYSLKDWFKGWVQTGGKYDGKPCAKQPGQTTKPYCRDADVRASMSKEERNKRSAKKRREDPNPNRSGKAKIVTQEEYIQEKKGEKDACYRKVKSRYKIWPSAYASGALVKCRKVGADNWGTKTEAANFAQQAAIAISMKKKGKKMVSNCVPVEEEYIRIQTRGTTYTIVLNWRGKTLMKQMFFPQFTRPSKLEVTSEVRKIYPNALVLSFYPSMRDPTQPLLFSGEK